MSVAAGQSLFCLTDTDDALMMIDQASPAAIVYSDHVSDDPGTLVVPSTLAIVRGCPRPERARRVVDWLPRPEAEARLATGPSEQVPQPKSRREIAHRIVGDHQGDGGGFCLRCRAMGRCSGIHRRAS